MIYFDFIFHFYTICYIFYNMCILMLIQMHLKRNKVKTSNGLLLLILYYTSSTSISTSLYILINSK
jgi:Ca2+/Na+ antiporter